MRIKVCRASGNPLKAKHIEQYANEYRALYDRVADKVTKGAPLKMTQAQASRATRLLDRAVRPLLKKYPQAGVWNFDGSKRTLQRLIKKHGSIAFALDVTGSPVLIILDAAFDPAG